MSSFQRAFRPLTNSSKRLFASPSTANTSKIITPVSSGLTSSAEATAHIPATQITTLPNGLRVASQRMHGESATVGLWVDTGSRYEDAKSNGVAHFLEHAFFKGTSRRDRRQLEIEVENIGGHLNAYTSRETTVFYAKVLKSDMGQALDIIADMTQNSSITQETVENERGVILREAQEVQQQTEEVVFDDLHTTAFQNTSLGRTILGSEENIRSITRDDLIKYLRTHYTAPRMVVVGAGDFDHSELVKHSEKLFGGLSSTPPSGLVAVKEPALFTGSDIRARYDDMPYAHCVYAFKTAGWNDADFFPLLVMQTMLGNWNINAEGGIHSGSQLVSELAKSNLAVSSLAFNTQYSDIGLFGVHVVGEDKALHELFNLIPYQITRLGYDVGQLEVEEAKTHLKMNILNILNGTTSVCEDIGRQVISHGRRIHPTEVIARIDAVDVGAIKRAAQRFVVDRDFALAAIGPIFELPDYITIRRRTYRNL